MNISTTVQQHYRREKVLSIDQSIDTVRDKFIQLSNTDIVCGHLLNLFTSRYKLKVRCDRDIICIDGPYGIKMMPLATEITLQPSPSRNGVTLNLALQFPIKYINSLLIVMLVLCTMTILLPNKILITLFLLVMSYIFSWVHFSYSSKIVLEFLHRELATIDRAY
jgi:hypothetical protein